ncbi:hypothetical protein FHR32_001984 [Streptosporangium album]|uniref:Uncharacterized protein n=1 Tax=Streptosporangium album TaxID=47479 RepID=A0A7W7W939_9ACTN|nr:hypothetical protein [Streptosporangium album]
MNIEKMRPRVEELSRRLGVNPPDVVYGQPPQGADCMLKRRGKNSLIVIGATFDDLPEHLQDVDLGWAIAASDRTRVRKEGVSTSASAGIGAVAGLVGAPLIFLFDSPIPFGVVTLTLLIVIGMPIIIRGQIYALDRRVAEVCGREVVHRALEYWQKNPPQMRGLYQLAIKLQPSMAKRAARLAPANL